MTDEEIDKLSGRELNAAVSQYIFGAQWYVSQFSGRRALFLPESKPHWFIKSATLEEPLASDWACRDRCYTETMDNVMLVVERMESLGYWCQMRTPFANDGYWAGFTPHFTTGWNGTPDHWTSAETLATAICRSALKTLIEDPIPPRVRRALEALEGVE